MEDIFDLTENEQEPKPLYIGLIGYNRQVVMMGFKYIRDNNIEQIARCDTTRGRMELTDGTVIKILSDRHMDGLRLDQLFICDDYRWSVCIKQSNLIDIASESMYLSCVPDNFKIQKYEV